MKKIFLTFISVTAILFTSCTKFLDCPPSAVLSEGNVQTASSIDGLVTAAYAELVNDYWNRPWNLWCFMEVGSDNCYKAGGSLSDQQNILFIEMHEGVTSTNSFYGNLWKYGYYSVGRCNTALQLLDGIDEKEYPLKKQRMAEMKFLRAQFYWRLLILFNDIVWVDENMNPDDIKKASNYARTPAEMWNMIYQDCVDAYSVLPETQADKGRPTKYAAAAAAAKIALLSSTKLDQTTWAYQGVDQTKMSQVLEWTNRVLEGGFKLNADFGTNFYLEGNNSKETIWGIQYSQDDGTTFGRANFSNGLNWPVKVSGCDFYKPSVNLINAFRTKDGIPMFEDYNKQSYGDYKDFGPLSLGTVDPRVYHTVSMPGVAFKLKQDKNIVDDNIYRLDWCRDPADFGPFATAKQLLPTTDPGIVWILPYISCTLTQAEYRLDDIILMKAEALIETGKWKDAQDLVNQIRNRAANSTTYFTAESLVPANYSVRAYTDAEWSSEEFARKALRWERRLELATEGLRFWDLIRWGIAEETLNKYYSEEKSRAPYLKDAKFDTASDTFGPIPNSEIVLSQGLYKQHGKY
ncbi:MAG: RagB/SusD family nutrient uptake outer membrane protein [Bacteroidales bacterium]|nr:RagB/SusD family nutrient uptake outer membrane protein [Bacteroidales bacterium]